MAKRKAKRIRRMRRLTAFCLSIMLFVGICSYAGVALAAELNTVRVNMRVSSIALNDGSAPVPVPDIGDTILDVDPSTTGGTQPDVVITAPNPAGTDPLPLPEVQADATITEDLAKQPTSEVTPLTDNDITTELNGYKDGNTQVSTDSNGEVAITTDIPKENVIMDKEPGTGSEYVQETPLSIAETTEGKTMAESDEAKAAGVAGTYKDANGVEQPLPTTTGLSAEVLLAMGYSQSDINSKEFLLQTVQNVEISADRSAAVVTSVTGTDLVKYVYNDATGLYDAVTLTQEEIDAAKAKTAVQVTLEADSLGSEKIFSLEKDNTTYQTPATHWKISQISGILNLKRLRLFMIG